MKSKEQIKEELDALRKEYQKAAQREFKAGLAELFEQCAEIQSISWTQYTPWFNDGDECVFRVNNEEPTVNGYSEYDDEDEGDGVNILLKARETVGYPAKPNPDYDPACAEIKNKILAFLGSFDNDAYSDMFGDHVRVTATRSGVVIEEHSHD